MYVNSYIKLWYPNIFITNFFVGRSKTTNMFDIMKTVALLSNNLQNISKAFVV